MNDSRARVNRLHSDPIWRIDWRRGARIHQAEERKLGETQQPLRYKRDTELKQRVTWICLCTDIYCVAELYVI